MEETMKILVLLGALAAIIPLSITLLPTSAEVPPVPYLTAGVSCEGPLTFRGQIEVTTDPNDPMSQTAIVIDEEGNEYETAGFGITGETLILLEDGTPLTAGIELGEPQEDL